MRCGVLCREVAVTDITTYFGAYLVIAVVGFAGRGLGRALLRAATSKLRDPLGCCRTKESASAVPTHQSQKRHGSNLTRVLLTYEFNPGIISPFTQALSHMIDTTTLSYTSFNGHKRIASGSLPVNALAVKHAQVSGAPGPLLTFCDQTGQVVEIDIRGSDAEMLARLPPEVYQLQRNEPALINSEESVEPRGRGRPKLGVVAREVMLLPRHWDWLATQSGSASVTLRKLVEEALRANVDRDRQRRASECAYHFMSAMAGDLAGFEEASRALFANDAPKFRQLTEAWPADIRDYVRHLAYPLPRTEAPSLAP